MMAWRATRANSLLVQGVATMRSSRWRVSALSCEPMSSAMMLAAVRISGLFGALWAISGSQTSRQSLAAKLRAKAMWLARRTSRSPGGSSTRRVRKARCALDLAGAAG